MMQINVTGGTIDRRELDAGHALWVLNRSSMWPGPTAATLWAPSTRWTSI